MGRRKKKKLERERAQKQRWQDWCRSQQLPYVADGRRFIRRRPRAETYPGVVHGLDVAVAYGKAGLEVTHSCFDLCSLWGKEMSDQFIRQLEDLPIKTNGL